MYTKPIGAINYQVRPVVETDGILQFNLSDFERQQLNTIVAGKNVDALPLVLTSKAIAPAEQLTLEGILPQSKVCKFELPDGDLSIAGAAFGLFDSSNFFILAYHPEANTFKVSSQVDMARLYREGIFTLCCLREQKRDLSVYLHKYQLALNLLGNYQTQEDVVFVNKLAHLESLSFAELKTASRVLESLFQPLDVKSLKKFHNEYQPLCLALEQEELSHEQAQQALDRLLTNIYKLDKNTEKAIAAFFPESVKRNSTDAVVELVNNTKLTFEEVAVRLEAIVGKKYQGLLQAFVAARIESHDLRASLDFIHKYSFSAKLVNELELVAPEYLERLQYLTNSLNAQVVAQEETTSQDTEDATFLARQRHQKEVAQACLEVLEQAGLITKKEQKEVLVRLAVAFLLYEFEQLNNHDEPALVNLLTQYNQRQVNNGLDEQGMINDFGYAIKSYLTQHQAISYIPLLECKLSNQAIRLAKCKSSVLDNVIYLPIVQTNANFQALNRQYVLSLEDYTDLVPRFIQELEETYRDTSFLNLNEFKKSALKYSASLFNADSGVFNDATSILYKALITILGYDKFAKIWNEYENVIDRLYAYNALTNQENFKVFVDSVEQKAAQNLANNNKVYVLNEKIRAYKKALNEIQGNQDELNDAAYLLKQLEEKQLPEEVRKKVKEEIRRMDASQGAEVGVQRRYIETVLKTPFTLDALPSINLAKAQRILDEDHFGLSEVKDHIIEHLATLSRSTNNKTPIICLVGPPGVGKTSLCRSIAKALGRKYARIALGGVRDESEIRGHRRTYIGAMPGRIIEAYIQVKTNNPLILLDEIDKLKSSNQGDPSAALLEVLDPEQNSTFQDHYLDIPYDLSNTLFIATANSYDMHPALADRMHVIDLSQYTSDEKFQIAKRHLVPKVFAELNIETSEFAIPDNVLEYVISGYTMEPGVRSLERRIKQLATNFIKRKLLGEEVGNELTKEDVVRVLGPEILDVEKKDLSGSVVGRIHGMSYSLVGGSLLNIEVAALKGNGKIITTGSLGDNIVESVKYALSLIRMRSEEFGLADDFYEKTDFHVHFPEAATKKDGPSAGAAITTALISALTKKPIPRNISMTGEISLYGEVLKIGGVKEKVISAYRAGVKHIVLPKTNMPDLYKVPEEIKAELNFYPVESLDQVLKIVLEGDLLRIKPPYQKSQVTQA